MVLYVVIAFFVYLISLHQVGTKPVRLTIDCGSNEGKTLGYRRGTILKSNKNVDVDSFCDLIHKAIPKAVRNGKFILVEQDQDMSPQSDTYNPIFQQAPRNFGRSMFDLEDLELRKLPQIKLPPLKLPKMNVPKLKPYSSSIQRAPRIGETMNFSRLRDVFGESSAERMDKFKKGIQKMLHVVKVLGQIDQYLSERTRIIIDKLSKTFSD